MDIYSKSRYFVLTSPAYTLPMAQKLTNVWSWNVSPGDLEKQLKGYDTLKITETYRGITVLTITALLALSLVLGYFEVTNLTDVLYSLVFYVPLLFFVYKGHRWAIITLLILWTIEKVLTLMDSMEQGNSPFGSIIWFLIVAPIIYKTYVVERNRNQAQPLGAVSSDTRFCSQCGKPISADVKFCGSCGNNILN